MTAVKFLAAFVLLPLFALIVLIGVTKTLDDRFFYPLQLRSRIKRLEA